MRSRNHENQVEFCERNGIEVGAILAGDGGIGETLIKITALGRDTVLAVTLSHDGKPSKGV